jgi:hypothetical protein
MPGVRRPDRQAANGDDAAPASKTMSAAADGYAQLWLACRVSCLYRRALWLRPGVRGGGSLKAEPAADAGPAAPLTPRLTARAAMVYLHGSNERQQAIADALSRQAVDELGRSSAMPSGAQHFGHDGAGKRYDRTRQPCGWPC